MRLQSTVKGAVLLEGKGIHSGNNVKVVIKKAPVDTGIIFIRTDLKNKPAVSADVSNLADYSGNLRCTSVEKDGVSVDTIEHLMAALSSLNIDNAEIEIDSRELPALDGSALDYVTALEKQGSVEQEKEKKELHLKRTILCREKGNLLMAAPSDSFEISYLLKYSGVEPMTQYEEFTFEGPKDKKAVFIKEIAPARTFCLESEAAGILEKGLGKGGDYSNALILRDGKPINNKFRLANEPSRHKIVDLLGDLALLNMDIRAHIIGIRSGHLLNVKLLRELEKLI